MSEAQQQIISKDSVERPFVSFCLFAYNQEQYIEDAVMGAFAQTYSPLEIILSDDCSTDGTYDVLKSLADSYQGPHRVKLYRNQQNVGICSHVNLMWQRSEGSWFFAAAGDDVSDPERVRRVMDLVRIKPNLKLVQTYLYLINNLGKIKGKNTLGGKLVNNGAGSYSTWTIQDRLANRTPNPHGACFCYTRELFDFFGPLPEGCIYEDNLINWRAEILGEAAILREALVYYRIHDEQVTYAGAVGDLKKFDVKRIKHLRDSVMTTYQELKDLESVEMACIYDEGLTKAIRTWILQRHGYLLLKLESITDPWPQRLHLLFKLYKIRKKYKFVSRDHLMRCLMPNSLYFVTKKLFKYLKIKIFIMRSC